MWIDPNSTAHFQQQVDQHGAVVLEGVPAPAERFITLSGSPRTNLAVVRAGQEGYSVLVADDLTPRVRDLAPYFGDQPAHPGWRLLVLPPSRSVAEALAYAGQVLGLDPGPEPYLGPAVPVAESGSIPAQLWAADEYSTQPPASEDPVREGRAPGVPAGEGPVRVPSAHREEGASARAALPFTTDLTEAARRGELNVVYGRQRETDQIVTILLQKDKCCPLLVGEPGTGKTAVVEKLASMSAASDLPSRLSAVQVLSLDLPQLLARSSHKGDVEKHITQLLDGLSSRPDALLFVDEIHNLAEARGDISIMDMLKPRLARGLRMIGATTHAEFKQKVQSDQALVRRFSIVLVNEPDEQETTAMLLARMPALEAHHHVHVEPEMAPEIVRLADEYFPDRRRPDSAFTLIDRAMAAEALKAARSQPDHHAP